MAEILTDEDKQILHKAEGVLLDLALRMQANGVNKLVYSVQKETYTDERLYSTGMVGNITRALYEIEKAKEVR